MPAPAEYPARAASPSAIPIQPKPKRTLHDLVPGAHPVGTVITRTWHPGDMARCRRCQVCRGVDGEVCTIFVEAIVAKADAENFSDRGFRWAGEAGGVTGRIS